MSRITDSFSALTETDIEQIVKDSFVGCARYLGAKLHPEWGKGTTPDECKALSAAERWIVSVWESNPTRVEYFTYAQGLQDGKEAVIEAECVGQIPGTPIYFAVDYNAAAKDMNAIRVYLQGVREGLALKYRLGVYGSIEVVNNVAADFYWQTSAWSGNELSPRACLYQDVYEKQEAAVHVDENEVEKPFGGWKLDVPDIQQHPVDPSTPAAPIHPPDPVPPPKDEAPETGEHLIGTFRADEVDIEFNKDAGTVTIKEVE